MDSRSYFYWKHVDDIQLINSQVAELVDAKIELVRSKPLYNFTGSNPVLTTMSKRYSAVFGSRLI
jgi:hypothetical protein